MKALVVFDSQYGNTAKIAEAVASGIAGTAVRVQDCTDEELKKAELVVVGSPTQGGRPTVSIQEFLDRVSSRLLAGKRVACFDTRFDIEKQNFALKLLMRTIGDAAPKMAQILSGAGVRGMVPAVGFFVTGKEGPITSGEIERAREWGKMIGR